MTPCRSKLFVCFTFFVSYVATPYVIRAQSTVAPLYSRLNTFSVFAEYANDSSRILLGSAVNRKIGVIGFEYQRRLLHRRFADLSYTAELRPAMIESDPTESDLSVVSSPFKSAYKNPPVAVVKCVARTSTYSDTLPGGLVFAGDNIFTCGRRQVFAQGFAPAGFTVNFRTRHTIQPILSSRVGYIFSTQQVPVPNAGSFNFAFDFGAGVEVYRAHKRSARVEYVLQHYSNKETGDRNPGVDSGFVRLTYAFGK